MPYAQVSDVKSLLPQVPVDAQSKPNEGQVTQFIADVESIVNAVLGGLGYTVPVTAPESVKLLRQVVAHGAAARTLRARASGQNTPADIQAARDLEQWYTGRLTALQKSDDPFTLPDAVVTIDPKPDQIASGFSSFAAARFDDDERFMTRDREF